MECAWKEFHPMDKYILVIAKNEKGVFLAILFAVKTVLMEEKPSAKNIATIFTSQTKRGKKIKCRRGISKPKLKLENIADKKKWRKRTNKNFREFLFSECVELFFIDSFPYSFPRRPVQKYWNSMNIF